MGRLALAMLLVGGCGGGNAAAEFTATEELGSRSQVEVTFESRVFPKANHELLSTTGTGACIEGRRGRRLTPRYAPAIDAWLRENVR